MRRIVLTVALVAPAIIASPSAAATREWPLKGFERVQLEAPADVVITNGPAFSIRAESDADTLGRLQASVAGDLLRIGWTRSPSWFHRAEDLHIAITMPRVAGAGVKGVGSIVVDRAEAPTVVFAVDGTGSVRVKAIAADKTVLAQSGTGSVDVAGSTRHLDARRSGVGAIDAERLSARSATLVSTGMGSLSAHVDGTATVTRSGMGSVDVEGHAVCTIKQSGMGSVTCGKGQ